MPGNRIGNLVGELVPAVGLVPIGCRYETQGVSAIFRLGSENGSARDAGRPTLTSRWNVAGS